MSTRSEIEGRFAAVAASLNLPVAYQNVTFVKPQNGKWLEFFMLASASKNRSVDGLHYVVRGAFQINVYGPLNTGLGALDSIVSNIINAFPVVPKVGTVSIEQPLTDMPALIVASSIMIPIRGSFRVEV